MRRRARPITSSSKKYDELLDEALAMPEAKQRQELIGKIEQNLRDSRIIIQTYWHSAYRCFRSGVHNCE